MHQAVRCLMHLWPAPCSLVRPYQGREPEAAQPAVPLPELVCRIPSRIGQLGDELLEVQPVALEDEADEVLAGRRRDRAKSADRKVAISTRPGSGAAL